MNIFEIINQELYNKLEEQLIIDEGEKFYPYLCPAGHLTIGVGRNLEGNGLSKEECGYLKLGVYTKNEVIEVLKYRHISLVESRYLLKNDIVNSANQLVRNLKYFLDLPGTVKIVLINMCFNMGISKLLEFKKTLLFISTGKYKEAADEMLDSKWKEDVKDRAVRLSNMMRNV